jgi:redox-sensitive bicupin YhaK (pirin superfamily)
MIDIRPFEGLAHNDHGWLDTRFHFSFADYHDPERMSWGRIRVWNDDLIAPKSGFPPHPHRDMEIITFVRTGAITHKDSMGNTGRTGAGDVQVMSAGTGVTHAEYNLEDEDTSLFQIWILPDSAGEAPDWGMREFPAASARDASKCSPAAIPTATARCRSAATPDSRGDAAGRRSVTYEAAPWRHQYLVATGRQDRVNGPARASPR